MNALKTTVLLAALTGLFLGIGFAIGQLTGLFIAFGFALVMNFVAYWSSDKLALRMAGAKEISMQEAPKLHSIVEEVSAQSGVPKPKVYIVENDTPNAFATVRNPKHAAVAVTTGIMGLLDERELRGVLGHELGHVKNRDILTSSIVATLAGAISMLAWMSLWFGGMGRDRSNPYGGLIALAAFLLAPLAAALIQAGISRTREFQADRTGAEVTHDPEALASALEKLHQGVRARPMEPTPMAQSTAHLYIVNPFRGGGLVNLFSTHPRIEERVRRLRDMAYRGA
ncbi:MAG: zinc metalloprotease HtpX [Phenylobacterium sp.]|nr:zinc metalloprotease HtpX [Phenylobacterium sp.]